MNKAVVDRKTLAWIKEGVEETLKSVEHAPDEFADNFDNIAAVEACIEPLQRVRGAVRMVGIYGATMLALELEYLAVSLAEGRIKQKREAAEVLATGMLQLPGYLESLYYGQPDMPLILLPLLNDIRAIQDKELLTEGEFFSPDLSIQFSSQFDEECIVSGDLPTVAKKLRPGYLSGLLGVITENNVTENLEKLILVVDNLLIASTSDKAKQLWWITSGVVDSLYEQGLEASIAVKILLGRVDQQIQRVIEHSEIIFEQDPPDKIIKNLLYYIAQSQTRNNRVIEIKKSFGLDHIDNNVVEKARENLYGFNVNLIDNISTQVKEEISKIKDALDVVMHAKGGSTTGLESVLTHFCKVADALGMLGMNKLRDLIYNYKTFLGPKIEQGETLGDEDLMGIAAALLHIESSLSEFGKTFDGSQTSDSLPPAEYEKLLQLIAKEITEEIKAIKDYISTFSVEPSKLESLDSVPQHLINITGAMRILRHDLQANLTQSILDYISTELIENQKPVSEISLELLANAIVGVENFYQTILEESVAPEIGLQVASKSISQLGYAPKDTISDSPNNCLSSTDQLSVG